MRILSAYTGTLTKNDIQVQTTLQKVLVEITGDVNQTVDAILGGTFIKIDKAGNKGQKPVVPKMELGALLDICNIDEGFINVVNLGDDEDPQYKITGTFDLTKAGALQCTDSDYLSIDITIPSTTNVISLNSLDVPFNTERNILYDPVVIIGGVPKDIPLEDGFAIAVPLDNGYLESLSIQYPTKTVTYLEHEIKGIMRDVNDLAVGGDVIKYGHRRWGVVSFDAATKAVVTPTGNTGFIVYVLRERIF